MFGKIFENSTLKNIIVAIVVLFIGYSIFKMFYLQERSIIEGMTGANTKDSLDAVVKHVENVKNTLNETLHLDKYKSDYENLIISLDETVDLMLIEQLTVALEKQSKSPTDVTTPDMIKKINELSIFKQNLNTIMDAVDKSTS